MQMQYISLISHDFFVSIVQLKEELLITVKRERIWQKAVKKKLI
ncbi:hypothetical protein PAAL109150_24910 [Paenibacillus alkaliterrae]